MGIAALLALAGCGAARTLEEAEARCTQRGGFLAVIYSQQITASGVGKPVGRAGECVLPSRFGVGVQAPGNAAPPAHQSGPAP